MDVAKKLEFYTIEDIYALPDGERAELIDGKIYYMSPPNTRHQRLVSDLHYQIKDFIKRNNGECEVFPSPFAVFLNENDKNYVEPDISVICDKNKITDKGCTLTVPSLRIPHKSLQVYLYQKNILPYYLFQSYIPSQVLFQDLRPSIPVLLLFDI